MLRFYVPWFRYPGSKLDTDFRFYRLDAGKQVLPLFNQLYVVDVHPRSAVTLTRITEKAPAALRPAKDSYIIVMCDEHAEWFWQRDPKDPETDWFDEVRSLEIDEKRQATIELKPVVGGIFHPTPYKPMKLTCRQGGLLTARGLSYKVLKVVAPGKLEGFGRLVGWIEISADPVKAKAEEP